METPTTNRPPSAGEGRGPSKTSSKSRTETGVSNASEWSRPVSEESASQGSPLIGPDGEAFSSSEGLVDSVLDRGRDLGRHAGELGKRVSTMTQEYTEREPTRAVLISLGVGVVLGAVIGALLARD